MVGCCEDGWGLSGARKTQVGVRGVCEPRREVSGEGERGPGMLKTHMKLKMIPASRLAVLCATFSAIMLAFSTNASAQLTIGDAHELGYVYTGIPSGTIDELTYVNHLIGMALGTDDFGDGQHYFRSNNDFGPLPTAVEAGAVSGSRATIDLGSGLYTYLFAKYDGPNDGSEVWSVGDLSGIITIPDVDGGGFGLFSWTLFTAAPDVPAATGAQGMGFWQNKNGQGIITGQAATGVCPSATWLRQYAPFQDLSATATCSQVAAYVVDVIKAANGSGSSMNPLLKAQMLATALNVYFSDPALGGNLIGAPEPIGGVSIDLTRICHTYADSLCTAYENAGSAFGGATCLTVSQLLSYAASQSNIGGSIWYGNVKATQELAKDTFDAINRQQAFAC